MPISIKQAVLDVANRLPDDCTWDDVMYQLYVRQKIDAGLEDASTGQVFDEEEVFAEWNP